MISGPLSSWSTPVENWIGIAKRVDAVLMEDTSWVKPPYRSRRFSRRRWLMMLPIAIANPIGISM